MEGSGLSSLPDLDDVVDGFGLLSAAERDRVWMDVERLKRRLSAVQAAMITTVCRDESYVSDGHYSPRAWVTAIANADGRTGGHQVRRARLLAALPVLRAAYAAGDVGDDQVGVLVKLHNNPRCGHLLRDSDDVLTGYARTLAFPDFVQVCARWLAHADPDGAHRDHVAARAGRTVSYRQAGHQFELRVRGDALTGEIIHDVLQAHAEAELLTDLAARTAEHGADSTAVLARTTGQRWFDALEVVALKAASTADMAHVQPTVVIHTTPHGLEDAISTFFGRPSLPQPAERLRLCETDAGTPVDPVDLVIAALCGRIVHIVSDPTGRPIKLGRRSRLFIGAAREAVLLMGDRCTKAGCEIRGGRIELDHTHPWGIGGLSDPDNAGPMCGGHNRSKHRLRITCTRDHTGWHYYRPDGTEIAPRTNNTS